MSKIELNKDVVEKDYWREDSHFVDFYNTVLFKGRDVLKADKLYEQDSDVKETIASRTGVGSIHRIKDVIKGYSDSVTLAVFGIENQTRVDYGMPLRIRIYSDLAYLQQCREIASESGRYRHLKSRDGKSGHSGGSTYIDTLDYISSLRKKDRLQAVFTIVIYYGERDWTGPVRLSDMMDIPEELKEYFDDSSLLLVSAKDLKDYDFKDRDNKQLFSLIHDFFYNKEKDVTEILRPYMGENIRRITLLTVGVIVGAEQLIEYALEGEKEEIDMCEAVRRWEKKIAERERAEVEKELAKERAIAEKERTDSVKGMFLGMKKLGIAKEEILKVISNAYNMTEEELLRLV